ncbi:peptidoglycan D,D-transpeptidase FtsI family protein [Arthrobacter cryoconiti]|uniref:Peptidoglycan D,D-transpeptidase FtsI family protein n=1 Tax=Arthrobacter cryoconiti TaxID=748907 RepID=A0ABV8QXE0_9MICC|nr:penicillin-binding protein 2 [Arthrobacter cryoconiti]MCC9067503.1 penicillin-binding protein 2 [Arthrobacter cryoconiti]
MVRSSQNNPGGPIVGLSAKSARRRMRVGISILIALLLIVSVKLVLIQGLDLNGNAEQAVLQRTVTQPLPSVRGKIIDANGKVLAESVLRYNITISPKNNSKATTFKRLDPNGNIEELTRTQGLTELAGVLGLDLSAVTKTASGDTNFAYVTKNVPPDTEDKVMKLRLPGVYSEATSERVYPQGSVGGNIVGFVGTDGKGLAGIEQSMNAKLTGKDGKRTYQRGANGIIIPTAPVSVTAPVNGEDVKLTVNSDIQFFAQRAAEQQKQQYSAEWANVVVAEVKTGKIIALGDTSTVDPGNPGASKAEDRGARSVTAAIEPGSTEKTVTAAALIQEGLIEPDTHLVIPPTYTVNGQTFTDAFPHGTENRTFAGVIGDSLNTGTVMAGEKLTPQQRYDYLHNFGIGQQPNIPLPGVSAGILAQPSKWDGRQEYTVLFGQGVAQTPLQTAMIYQTIANNGVRLDPQIVDAYIAPDGTEEKVPQRPGTTVVSPQTAQKVRDILESVTTVADAKNVSIPGYRVGGKTGTAESPADNGHGFDGYTSSFAGMAPMDDPQYVVLITVQRPQGLIYGVSQGPTFNEVMGQVLQTYNVPPSTTPSVKLPQYFDQ